MLLEQKGVRDYILRRIILLSNNCEELFRYLILFRLWNEMRKAELMAQHLYNIAKQFYGKTTGDLSNFFYFRI